MWLIRYRESNPKLRCERALCYHYTITKTKYVFAQPTFQHWENDPVAGIEPTLKQIKSLSEKLYILLSVLLSLFQELNLAPYDPDVRFYH